MIKLNQEENLYKRMQKSKQFRYLVLKIFSISWGEYMNLNEGKFIHVDINKEMKKCYIDYAMR